MGVFLVLLYLSFGLWIARSMKDATPPKGSGLERFGYFIAWPIMYLNRFIDWLLDTFID